MTTAAEARCLLDGCRELYLGHRPARDALLPPHDLEAETVVLSAVLWGERQASELRLRPGWLWQPDNRCTWAVLLVLEELGNAGRVAWGGVDVRGLPSCQALGVGVDERLAARVLARLGSGPLWYWQRRLRRIMGYGGDPEECARVVRDRARERRLIVGLQRVEAALRAGEEPSAELLRWTARRLEQMAVDGGRHD